MTGSLQVSLVVQDIGRLCEQLSGCDMRKARAGKCDREQRASQIENRVRRVAERGDA